MKLETVDDNCKVEKDVIALASELEEGSDVLVSLDGVSSILFDTFVEDTSETVIDDSLPDSSSVDDTSNTLDDDSSELF